MRFNEIQTSLDILGTDGELKELKSELIDMIDSIMFINNLVSPTRRYAKDMPKDKDGKVIVDIVNPHILEDMDYFRQSAIHHQKHGKYTELYPSANPSSEYSRFWREEARRCREGLVRPYDGEWIPGAYYFYLNYGPILRTVITEGSKRGERVREFPDVYDGDYLYFHYVEKAREEGKHCMVLKKREAGFSFKAAVQLARLFVLGDTEKAKKEIAAFAIANEKEYLIKDGVLNKFVDAADWTAKNTPWPRIRDLRNSMNEMHWKMGYKDSDTGTEEGTENEVIGVTLKDDPHKARGKRGVFIFWEEIGKFPDVITSWTVARPSVEESDWAYGTMIGYGTGGEEGVNFKGAEEFFYNPNGYNIYAIPNVFDKNVMGKQLCSFFFPEYMNRLGYYDKNGNSNVIGALIAILKKRLTIKYGTSDPNTLVQEKAEHPCTPQEAIMRKEGSLFPIADLKDYLADISPNMQKFLSPHYVGRLKLGIKGDVEWSNEQQHPVIRTYPLKDELDRNGNVELFEMPKRNAQGKVPFGRYIAGIDPIDYDSPFGLGSLGSIFIFDLWTDRIVAEYTGRPQMASEFYETCLRLLQFYNAVANYENNLKGLFAYFDKNRVLHYLCDTPMILRDMDYVKGAMFGNKSKGTSVNKAINAWGRKLQADWMLHEAYLPFEEEELDDDGNIIERPRLLNLHKIRSIGYLKEAISWNEDDNFDRISAMSMVMIFREDRMKYEIKKTEERIKTIYDDPWFKRNYNKSQNSFVRRVPKLSVDRGGHAVYERKPIIGF